MVKLRSKNDAYFSYRYRCQKAGKPFMTVDEFWKSRKKGEKKKDGSFKPDWNKPDKRFPLMWLQKYGTVELLEERQKELMLSIVDPLKSKRVQQHKNQLKRVNLALDILRGEI